jgi:hypothetical protein
VLGVRPSVECSLKLLNPTPGQIRAQTRELVREVCSVLCPSPGAHGRASVQGVESRLSMELYATEEHILRCKQAGDSIPLDVYRDRRNLIKRLADTLAWQFFGHESHRLRVYAAQPPISFMAGKSGYWAEREAISHLWSAPQVAFVLQNDITNVLRVGDVAVLTDSGAVRLLELKSGRVANERLETQKSRFEAISDYLRTDYTESVFDKPMHAIEVPHSVETYWGVLQDVADAARANGHAYQRCDEFVTIVCSRLGMSGIDTPLKELKPEHPGDRITTGLLNRHFDSMDNDVLRFVEPPTAFGLRPETAFDLAVGDTICAVLLRLSSVERRLREQGFVTGWKGGKFRVNYSVDSGFEVGDRLWSRVLYGLLSAESFLQIVGGAASTTGSKHY